MTRLRGIAVLLGLCSASAGVSRAQDFKQRYVGKDPCALKLKGDYDFSLRLDKTRNAELRALDTGNASIVMIIPPVREVLNRVTRDLNVRHHAIRALLKEMHRLTAQAAGAEGWL